MQPDVTAARLHPELSGFRSGDRIWWGYTPRGGYGYGLRAAGVVVSVGRSRVRVRVMRRYGSEWREQCKYCKPENLRPRTETVDVVDRAG
jgi:hypothetical protein